MANEVAATVSASPLLNAAYPCTSFGVTRSRNSWCVIPPADGRHRPLQVVRTEDVFDRELPAEDLDAKHHALRLQTWIAGGCDSCLADAIERDRQFPGRSSDVRQPSGRLCCDGCAGDGAWLGGADCRWCGPRPSSPRRSNDRRTRSSTPSWLGRRTCRSSLARATETGRQESLPVTVSISMPVGVPVPGLRLFATEQGEPGPHGDFRRFPYDIANCAGPHAGTSFAMVGGRSGRAL